MVHITVTITHEIVAPGVLEVRVLSNGIVTQTRRYYLMLCRRTHTPRYYAAKAAARY